MQVGLGAHMVEPVRHAPVEKYTATRAEMEFTSHRA